MLNEVVLLSDSNALKSNINNMKRFKLCLNMHDENSIFRDPILKFLYNIVHIDKTWFYKSEKSTNYNNFLSNDDDSYHTCINKNNIKEVYF